MRARRREGFALAASLSMVGVVLVLGLAYGARTSAQLHHTTRTVQSIQASYLCEAGVQYARENVGAFTLPYQTMLQFETGRVTLTITDGVGGQRVVRSHASSGAYGRTLTVVMNGASNVVSWTESVP